MKINIAHIDNAHSDWIRALDFYRQEMAILRGRLTELASRNTGREVMSQVEHYENQLKVQVNNIDTLEHEIAANAIEIGRQAKESAAGYIEKNLAVQHTDLSQRFERQEEIVNQLRRDFNRFAMKWM